MNSLFETRDVEAARDMLTSMYRLRRCTAADDRPFLRIRRDRQGPIDLQFLTIGMTCDVLGDPSGLLYLGHVVKGAIACHQDGERLAWETGDVFLAAQPDLPCRVEVSQAELEFIVLDVALLSRVADTEPGRSAEPIRFTGYRPTSPECAMLWFDTYAYVRDAVGRLPDATAPLLLGSMSRLVAATALATFPNTALRDPTIEERHDAHPASLRRAIAFIDENAHRDISTTDIAAASNITLRTLQLAFRRHLDCTPRSYLRRVRLDRVHDDLRTADPATTTVMSIAARWGFINHSRFTAFYRATYGITPSHTLRYV